MRPFLSTRAVPRFSPWASFLILIAIVLPLVARQVAGQNLDIVPIAEIGGSGVLGDVTLIDNGDGTTTVDILVSGVTGDHPATIRKGRCENPGAVVYTLDPIAADGTSVSEIDIGLSDFLSTGPWSVMIRRSSTASAPTIACGTVEVGGSESHNGSPATSQPTPPPSTPTPTNPTTPTPPPTATATVDPALPTCGQFDAWVWAQSVFQEEPEAFAPTLDPDGNGVACEQLPMNGFAPASWTNEMPEGLTPVRVTGFYNGDTLQVLANGQFDVVHLNGVSAPTASQCGYSSAGSFLAFVLNLAPNLTLYVDYQNSVRDEQNRLVTSVWYDYGGDPYLINEVVARNGWADAAPLAGLEPYADQIGAAAEFAADHVLGVHFECGGFGQPAGSTPTAEQIEQARDRQPNQGQFR